MGLYDTGVREPCHSGYSPFSSDCSEHTFTNVHVREEMCNSSKTSELRHPMPCNEVPEVAYLYRYLPVSARETPGCGPILAYFAVTRYGPLCPMKCSRDAK